MDGIPVWYTILISGYLLYNRKVFLLHNKPSGQEAHSALRKHGCLSNRAPAERNHVAEAARFCAGSGTKM